MDQLFDVNRQIDIKLGEKKIIVRFPSDDELAEWQRKRKMIVKQLGRGMSETIVPDSEEINAELVAKLRVDEDGTEIDPYEATVIIEQLTLCEVLDVIAEGDIFTVLLAVPGAETQIKIKMPSAKQIIQYRRAFARVIDLPFNKQSIALNLIAASELFKALQIDSKNYAGSTIPINHQATALRAVINTVENGLGGSDPQNF